MTDWARYQNLAGDLDNVETSAVQGNYDWRAYLHEEAEAAAKRHEKPAKRVVGPAPAVIYS